jgi:hypothetical protein
MSTTSHCASATARRSFRLRADDLLLEPRPDERNPEYALKLQRALRDLGCFPMDYVDSVIHS